MKKSIKIIVAILITFMLMLATKSYAALESKVVSGTNKMKSSVIDAFQLCYDMRNPTSSLGNNNLDPHLMLNKDLGAYAYLGMSAYGTNGVLKNVSITGWAYQSPSTTDNQTGVIHMSAYGKTAGVYSNTESAQKYGNTKYVEVFNGAFTEENTKGMAIKETWGWYGGYTNGDLDASNVTIQRYYNNNAYGYLRTYENSNGANTFRPVIWNQ